MAFNKSFRGRFPKDMQNRFRCYWHVMHPVTFDSKKIYRAGWSDEAWAAWHLIKKTREEVLKTGYRWTYEWNWTASKLPFPDYVSVDASLSWVVEKDYPTIAVQEHELDEAWREKMRVWICEAYRYKVLGQVLHDQIKHLIRVHTTYTARNNIQSETSLINTPAQLLAIWPELIAFLWAEDRDEMRGRRMKFSAPRDWTPIEQRNFHAVEGMAELTHALQTMALIPEETDANYPELSA